jgi:hypothetical protein
VSLMFIHMYRRNLEFWTFFFFEGLAIIKTRPTKNNGIKSYRLTFYSICKLCSGHVLYRIPKEATDLARIDPKFT